MHVQVQNRVVVVPDFQDLFSSEAFAISRVDDAKFAGLERSILHLDADEEQVREFHHVDWTNSTFPEEVRPILLCVAVIDSVLEVVWKKVVHLNRRLKAEPHIWINTSQGVLLIVGCMQLEKEWRGLIIL